MEDLTLPAEVFGIPLLFDQIFKDLPTRDLFTLRYVCQAWNNSVLSLLKKRNDFTIKLSQTTLSRNDPCCFLEEDRKFLLRRVTLRLGEERKVKRRLHWLHCFLELHQDHIVHLNAFTPDFFHDVWNKWTFPKLESLVMPEDFDFWDTPIPTFVAEKATVTKLSLLSYYCNVLGDRLLAATPSLQELHFHYAPNLSLLTTTTLRVLELQDFECSEENGILSIFLRRHGPGLEKLKISFTSSYSQIPKLVFETPMAKLKELWLGGSPVQLENFGPAMFPLLESLRLKLGFLEQDSLAIQQGSFDKLTHFSVCISYFEEKRNGIIWKKLLSMCETAKNVDVWLNLRFHRLNQPQYPSLMDIVNPLACRGILKELKLHIEFEVEVDGEGVATCTNLEYIDERMKELRSLVDNGLERLLICVTDDCPRGEDLLDPVTVFYVDDWGENFVTEVLDLASRMKYVQLRGAQVGQGRQPDVFSPALEERVREAMERLPLEVRWTENYGDFTNGF